MIVQKYGGSVLRSLKDIEAVAKHIVETAKKDKVVVVVSAMKGETDDLLKQAREISNNPPLNEVDELLGTGETKAATLLAIAITELGKEAVSLTGREIKIETDSKRKIKGIAGIERIKELTDKGKVVVVTGFQGMFQGEVVTLGRGGSDLTAIALAAALGSNYCENFTDVDGIYAVDPRIVPRAKRYERISHNNLVQFTGAGGGKLMDRAALLAQNLGVEIRVLLSSSCGSSTGGTLVCFGSSLGEMESQDPGDQTGLIIQEAEQVKISGVLNESGVVAKIFSVLSDINIIDSVQTTKHRAADITLLCAKKDMEEAISRLRDSKKSATQLGEVGNSMPVSGLTLVSPMMKEDPNYFIRIFNAISRSGVNIETFSSSNITIMVVVKKEEEKKAARALAEEFQLIDN